MMKYILASASPRRKELLKQAGIDCGPCRLPIAPCSEEELEETRNELKNTEFFKYIN